MFSNKKQDTCSIIGVVTNDEEKKQLIADEKIIKLHYKESYKCGSGHRNWGDVKGEDCYSDVCVFLNKKTQDYYKRGQLNKLPEGSRNKLYVAITRAHNNVFFIYE